jgi:signal transduction histidine kinase
VPLRSVAEAAARLVDQNERDSGVAIAVSFDTERDCVIGDPVLLQQVFVNLLTNAVQAVRDGAERIVRLHATASASQLFVRIEDSGPGFSPEARRRAFDTFYSTRSNGTGIGLTLCRTVVEAHGGEAWIARAARGAAVAIRLPLAKAG